ncbi:protein of unknown function [Candidatus Filomicrobium marinum]|uniref:Uncharacterized protein n=1 Tax=Candidatus Filomicrobium marinum TaxID=1608628 RepID=A0A0D6JBA4_9HYPH|nr:protein of unknown function [Candidatus Filomicrobium marinum]
MLVTRPVAETDAKPEQFLKLDMDCVLPVVGRPGPFPDLSGETLARGALRAAPRASLGARPERQWRTAEPLRPDPALASFASS